MSKWVTCLACCAALVTLTAAKTDSPTDCDPNKPAPVLDNSSGKLKIQDVNKLAGKTCEWVVDATNKSNPFIHLTLTEDLFLSANDSLMILNEEDKNTTLYSSSGYLSAGIILIGQKTKKARVKIYFASQPQDTSLGIYYSTNTNAAQVQNIANPGSFVFPHPNTIDLGLGKLSNFSLTLMARSTKNLLVNFEQWDLNGGSVTFDKVDKYKSGDKFDKSEPEFLLSTENQINMNITMNVKTDPKTWKGIRFHFELVDSVCSQYQMVTDLDMEKETIHIKQPNLTEQTYLTAFRCLNIYEHSEPTAKFLVDLRNFKFLNKGDLITVEDGMSRDSKTLGVIDSQYIDEYWRQVYLYSTTNKIWIMYESPQVINRTPPQKDNDFGVRPLSQGGRFVFDANTTSTTLNVVNKKTPTPVVFVYTADPEKQILIDFDEKNVLPGNGLLIGISDNSMRSGQPFIKMNGQEYPPDLIASNGNQLRVEFYQTENLKVDVKVVERGCHASVVDTSGASYSLSGCKDLCSWLIPKRDNSPGTFVVQFSSLNLNAKTDEISMEELPSKRSVFKFTGPLMTTSFPEMVLDANRTYVMYTRRQCPKTVDNSQVLAASLVYDNGDQTTHSVNVSKDKENQIMTSNYPNYYSIGSDHTFKIGKSNPNDTVMKTLVTFTDLDLVAGHQLLLWSANATTPKQIDSKTLSDLSDLLVDLPFLLNLTSHSFASPSPPFSARGFSANLTTVGCGGSYELTKNKSVNIALPPSLSNVKKCIWTVTTDNLNATFSNILNVTIEQGKDKLDMTKLKFYDSNSIRDSIMMNLSYFANNTYLLSSTNSLIIEYEVPQKNPTLNLTLTVGACPMMCWKTMRCSIPQFHCNGFNDCGDWSDENCGNGTAPQPAPQPGPGPNITYKSGVNGWVVLLVICPLCIGIGVLGTLFGPQLLNRFGRGRYREFQDFSEVS